jgi:hypothetical protein
VPVWFWQVPVAGPHGVAELEQFELSVEHLPTRFWQLWLAHSALAAHDSPPGSPQMLPTHGSQLAASDEPVVQGSWLQMPG